MFIYVYWKLYNFAFLTTFLYLIVNLSPSQVQIVFQLVLFRRRPSPGPQPAQEPALPLHVLQHVL